jgi:DNA-binding GntR family transcriptional regulator
MTNASIPPDTSAIEFLKTSSLADVVRHEIEAMIVNGLFMPNQHINEFNLAQKLGVSRAPVREACRTLAAIGLLEYVPNRGIFVPLLDDAELHDVAQARAYALASVASVLAERITDSEVAVLLQMVEEMDAVAKRGDVSDYYPINLRFHDALCAMCGNRRMATSYQSFARELHVQRFRTLAAKENLVLSNSEHAAIVAGLAARDPMQSMVAARTHVLNGFTRIKMRTAHEKAAV